MWLLLALIYSLLIAIIIVFDRFIVANIFSRPLQGIFITIPTSIAIILGLAPLLEWNNATLFTYSLLGGALLQASQVFYFLAMDKTDQAGDLSAIEASYPIFIAIFSVLLGQILSGIQWLGVVIVTSSIILFSWQDIKKPDKWYLTFLGADIILLVFHGLIVSHILQSATFLAFYGAYSLGIVVTGISIFVVIPKERRELFENWHNIRQYLPQLSIIEIANILALLSATYALGIGHPALVTAVMTTYPAFVFLFSLIADKVYHLKGFSSSRISSKKVFLLTLIIFGIALVS